jgi:hypothetical protein
MKAIERCNGLHGRSVLSGVLCNKALEPTIILRKDDPQMAYKMQRYFRTRKSVFVRFGSTCTFEEMCLEILLQLNHEPPLARTMERIMSQIVAKSKIKSNNCIVIDYCHRILPVNLSYVLGLVYELEANTQFIFMFNNDRFKNWCTKNSKDKLLKYFLSNVTLKYEIS